MPKQVIGELLYDTDSAEFVAEFPLRECNIWNRSHTQDFLYRTEKGKYFVFTKYYQTTLFIRGYVDWEIWCTTPQDARKMLESENRYEVIQKFMPETIEPA